jgi:hypothetical protein
MMQNRAQGPEPIQPLTCELHEGLISQGNLTRRCPRWTKDLAVPRRRPLSGNL